MIFAHSKEEAEQKIQELKRAHGGDYFSEDRILIVYRPTEAEGKEREDVSESKKRDFLQNT